MFAPAVQCSKEIRAPESFSFQKLLGRDSREIVDYARKIHVQLEFDTQRRTIRVTGKYERVQDTVAKLKHYMEMSARVETKKSVERKRQMLFCVDVPRRHQLHLTQFNGLASCNLMSDPYVFQAAPASKMASQTEDSKIGAQFDTLTRLEPLVRTFAMLGFSEAFDECVRSEFKPPYVRFELGYQLFFPSKTDRTHLFTHPSPVSVSQLRQMEEGPDKDIRAMFSTAVHPEMVLEIEDRLETADFTLAEEEQAMMVRVYDHNDKKFFDVHCALIPRDRSFRTRVLEIYQSFGKCDTFSCVTPYIQSPDFRIVLDSAESLGPSHPAVAFLWSFAARFHWSVSKQIVKLRPAPLEGPDYDDRRFEIVYWKFINQRTLCGCVPDSPDQIVSVSCRHILEEDGNEYGEIIGHPNTLNETLSHSRSMPSQRLEQLCHAILKLIH